LFENDSAVPTETLTAISALLSDVMAMTSNKVAVDGYVRTYPVTLIKNPTWDLSAARAQAMRQLLEQSGLSDVSAHGTVLRDCVAEGLQLIFTPSWS
jgi:chemotaxis protein MotB